MSHGSDYIADHCFDTAETYLRIDREAERGFWKTKDGRAIHVRDMTDDHLRNCIRMLERDDMMIPWICRMRKELERRAV